MFLYYSSFSPGCDRISPDLDRSPGGGILPTNGAGGVAILAGIKLGISSLYILVIWRKRGKMVGSRIPLQDHVCCNLSSIGAL